MRDKQKTENEKTADEKTALTKGNSELKEQLANLNTKLAETKWQSFRGIGQKESILVGDGNIRHVKQQYLKDTEVICEDKSLAAAFEVKIGRLKRGYENMNIVIRSADSRQVVASCTSAVEVVNSFRGVVTAAKEKARNVTISSIPPVINPPDTDQKKKSPLLTQGYYICARNGKCRSRITLPCSLWATVPSMTDTLNKMDTTLPQRQRTNLQGGCKST